MSNFPLNAHVSIKSAGHNDKKPPQKTQVSVSYIGGRSIDSTTRISRFLLLTSNESLFLTRSSQLLTLDGHHPSDDEKKLPDVFNGHICLQQARRSDGYSHVVRCDPDGVLEELSYVFFASEIGNNEVNAKESSLNRKHVFCASWVRA